MRKVDGEKAFNSVRGAGPQRDRIEITFADPVRDPVVAILRGFDVKFTPPVDRPLGNLEIRLDPVIDPLAPQRVWVEVTYGLRDWSHEWDDPYEGTIQFTVICN